MNNNVFNSIFSNEIACKGKDVRARYYIAPKKVIAKWGDVTNCEHLVDNARTQARIDKEWYSACTMRNEKGNPHAAILIDYGAEIHGCVRMVMLHSYRNSGGSETTYNVRFRFGESISEAITPIGTEKNATNGHAVRDGVMEVSFASAQETGETGFRYLYLELLDEDTNIRIDSVPAVLICQDLPYIGSFECDDERLNRIWKTAAYTVHLNMQEYLWDGIKRDRVVWFGDMNTEVETALYVFGDTEVVRRSMDYGAKETPLPKWMNNIPSYSFWWIINLYKIYMHTGDLDYLKQHKSYIVGLTKQILNLIDGKVEFDGGKRKHFIDWSTESNTEAQQVAFYGLLGFVIEKIIVLLKVFGEDNLITECTAKKALMITNVPNPVKHKVSAALLALGGIADAKYIDENFIEPGGAYGYSTFMGYSILNAKALANNKDGAIRDIRDYWGGMLDMGATTFWEDFDIDWINNSTRIDEFPQEGKNDIHGDFGKHCYIGLRHSLCHGWSAGPCPWLIENVLGVKIIEPGMKVLEIKPHLGDLRYAKGSIPTPFGTLYIEHKKDDNGEIKSTVKGPEDVEIIFCDHR